MYFEYFEDDCERDIPLLFYFTIKNKAVIVDRLKALGYPKPKNAHWEAARLSIFAEAVAAYDIGREISYSRNQNFYSHLGRYYGTAFSFDRVVGSIDQAAEFKTPSGEKCPLLESYKVTCYSKKQSTFKATPRLVELFEDVDFEFQFFDVIRLREDPPIDERKSKTKWKKVKGWMKVKKRSRLIDYVETDETRRMRAEIEKINAYLENVGFRLPPVLAMDKADRKRLGRFIEFDEKCVLQGPLKIHRSFCRGSFNYGGRAYGWWQQLSKELRAQILLGGEKVAEPDFSQFHATILYAQRGLKAPDDAY